MKIQQTVRVAAFLFLFAIGVCLTALAQTANKVESVASVTADRTEVRWQPQVEYGHLILTISTPGGETIRKEFEAGIAPSFKLTDDQGYDLSDGYYSYELRVVPRLSKTVTDALAASRKKGNTAEVMKEFQATGQLPTRITVQSGSFLFEKGVVYAGSEDGAEPRDPNRGGDVSIQKKKGNGTVVIQDVVTPDDAIIQGSACVGLDCVNGEVFGFDTIRLKENNTRLQFDDTSTGAGFATNNWQIRANSSASGGASFLGFVDQGATGNSETGTIVFSVTAGAPANSLFVSSTGRVGVRTGTPVLDMHIATGDTPAHRLEQTNAGGFTAQTWDIAGNEANFFVRDVTSGSRLPFRIRPGAPTSSIDISATGNVGIGNASPIAPITFAGATGDKIQLFPSTAGARFGMGIQSGEMQFYVPSGGQHFSFNTGGDLQTSGTNELVRINSNGNVGIGTTTPAGKLDVNGSIFQRGIQLFADYVFEPTYALESIEEHADFMWNNKHLPAVGAKKVDEQGREVVE
ncbi:MAG: hypothetical protein WAV20_12800, partial [Blastocatellia bacterium]